MSQALEEKDLLRRLHGAGIDARGRPGCCKSPSAHRGSTEIISGLYRDYKWASYIGVQRGVIWDILRRV